MTTLSVNIALTALLWTLPVMAQPENGSEVDSPGVRWKNIADSILARIQGPGSGRIALVVESEKDRSTIENAFIASCEKKGFQVVLTEERGSIEVPLLRISGVVSLGTPSNEVSCEARVEEGEKGSRYLGRFYGREKTDEDRGSVLERFIEPLVVIAGSVMIVYLFFTVRS